ncbi:ycii-related domain protein [Phlyctema vagabunda]|uniref:Ycii-related domain protein n=1 Tax=Phlyctema vagabunda TaxID=108571 RepID=A0ABR4PEB2_9HELO
MATTHIQAARTVAKTSVAKKASEWLVILADRPGVLDQRIQIRPTHSKNFVKLHEAGIVSWAGPVFTDHSLPGTKRRPFVGSVIVMNAPSVEAVRKTLEKDIFVTQGIWDWEAVKILPFETTLRKPVEKAGSFETA